MIHRSAGRSYAGFGDYSRLLSEGEIGEGGFIWMVMKGGDLRQFTILKDGWIQNK